MKIGDLVTALQPLAGWHVHAVSGKCNDTFPCYSVRRLGQHEREAPAGQEPERVLADDVVVPVIEPRCEST